MICGYCFKEMKSGTLKSKDKIIKWIPDKIGMNLMTVEIENGLDFYEEKGHTEIKAYLCTKCNKLIIDLNRLDSK